MVAIGTDFGGIWCNLEIEDCSQLYLLADALKRAGFSEDDVDCITHKNVLRVLEDTL